jgi:hypothetical protein
MEDVSHEQSSRSERSRDTQSITDTTVERRVPQRECPWCNSRRTHLVQRGFTGPTDERDQYLTCDGCGRITLDIVSKTMREMRVGQFRMGGTYRDSLSQTKYTITRVLKVGLNEYLLYLKPIIRRDPT